jgi:hypothetical protein
MPITDQTVADLSAWRILALTRGNKWLEKILLN